LVFFFKEPEKRLHLLLVQEEEYRIFLGEISNHKKLTVVHIDVDNPANLHLVVLINQALDKIKRSEKTVGLAVRIMTKQSFLSGFNKFKANPWLEIPKLGERDHESLPQYHNGGTLLNKAIKKLVEDCFLAGFQFAIDNPDLNIQTRTYLRPNKVYGD